MNPDPTALKAENESLRAALAERDAEIRRLELKVKDLAARIYGPSSERSRRSADPNQGVIAGIDGQAQAAPEAFFADEPAPAPAKRQGKASGAKRGPKPLPAHLPREIVVLPDPDLPKLICPETRRPMKAAFQQETEILCRKPAEYYVTRYVRNVFVSEARTAPVASPWPSRILPRARVDVSLIAEAMVKRYLDHIPFARQEEQFARLGLSLSRSTLVSWAAQAEALAEPLVKRIRETVLKSGYIQLDATPLDVCDPGRPGSVREACVWVYRAACGPAFYEYAANKSGETPAAALEGFKGLLQTDGASNFGGAPAREGVTHLGCWSHARRYFVKARQAGEPEADELVRAIDRIFRLEALLRRCKVKPDRILEARRRHSLPIVEMIVARAKVLLADRPLAKTALAKAAGYLLRQEAPLRACFATAEARIDNNLVENAIRPLKLGAKNWLFIGHPDAGPRAANLFTLVLNCRIEGINPEEYLADVFARMPDHPASRIDDFLPQNWIKSRNQAREPLAE
jgi:transposase